MSFPAVWIELLEPLMKEHVPAGAGQVACRPGSPKDKTRGSERGKCFRHQRPAEGEEAEPGIRFAGLREQTISQADLQSCFLPET